MRSKFRNNSGNPLQRGNAMKNENFDKAVFRILGISITIVLFLAVVVHLLRR